MCPGGPGLWPTWPSGHAGAIGSGGSASFSSRPRTHADGKEGQGRPNVYLAVTEVDGGALGGCRRLGEVQGRARQVLPHQQRLPSAASFPQVFPGGRRWRRLHGVLGSMRERVRVHRERRTGGNREGEKRASGASSICSPPSRWSRWCCSLQQAAARDALRRSL
jgi:hypothetical protein